MPRSKWTTTPLPDLLRGRLTGRLDVEARLDGLDLPPEVIAHAQRIAKRTRLPSTVRADIAVELGEDAALAISQGATVPEALAAMGPARSRARAIRRERLKTLPFLSRFRRRLGKRTAVALGAFLILYAVWSVRFHAGRPVIKRNFAAEHNARLAAIPESDRGLAHYLEARAKSVPVPEHLSKRWPALQPTDKEWPEIVQHLRDSGPALDALRRGAAAPVLGYPMSDSPDPAWNIGGAAGEPRRPASANPPVIDIALSHLGAIRGFARLLRLDAREAAASGDAARAIADLHAIIRMAGHCREMEVTICDLVAVAIVALAAGETGELIAAHPGLFTDEQLAGLASAFTNFAGSAGGPIRMRLNSERAFIEDWIQRGYTDNGRGDGRICMQGLRNWSAMGPATGPVGATAYIFGPINAMKIASRKEITAEWERLVALAEQDAATPRWQKGEPLLEQAEHRINSSPSLRRKFLVLTIILPAITKAEGAMQTITQQRDATLMVIALERCRLRHNRYPDRLDDVVPDFAPAVARDSFDGGPMKYRLSDGRPLLYVLGGDCDDDGGTPPPGDRGNEQAMTWRPPSRRAACPDGDYILWPPIPDPPPEPESD